LARCVRRLKDIVEELGTIGNFLEQTPKLVAGPEFEARLAEIVERNRLPGFCGHRLLQECRGLIELIAVRVAVLRQRYEKQSSDEDLRRLQSVELFCEGLAPLLDRSEQELSVFSSLDPVDQLRAIVARR
jgi:hypothetical protein